MTKHIIIVVILLSIISINYCLNTNNEFETCDDEKCYKNLIKTRPNLMILFLNNDKAGKDVFKLFRDVNQVIKDTATLSYINCDKAKKLCKKLKINPNTYELKYYKDGTYLKDYDRSLVKKSLINFFNEPNEIPWDEDNTAKDVIHISDENNLNKQLKKYKNGILIMFYAPWCGYCKKLKPDFAAAATELKNTVAIGAMNVDNIEGINIKKTYNITGYPTLLYFKSGQLLFNYGGKYDKNGLIEWLKNPKPAEKVEEEDFWAGEQNVKVTFLTDDDFDAFISQKKHVLVMFYAPWCGHCKNMKPIYNSVAKRIIDENIDGVLAAVDATKQRKLAEKFKLKGFPTVKFFKDSKYAFDFNEREETKIYEFIKNPDDYKPPEPEPEWKDEPNSHVIHLNDENFSSFIKTKKHSLVFFYAPWCGHCKKAKPHFSKAAETLSNDPKVSFCAVDCTVSKVVCPQNNIQGFPTIIHFNFGKNPQPYNGDRLYSEFVKFMMTPNESNQFKFDIQNDWIEYPGYEHIHFLDETNFEDFIKTNQRVLVFFYLPWCEKCKQIKAPFAEAASSLKNTLPVASLAAIDASKSAKYSSKYQITEFPALKYFENGLLKFDYRMGKTKNDFITFMLDPKPVKTEL